jgi:hypothetical protein
VSDGEQVEMNGKAKFSSEAIHSFVDELFGEDLHAKWVTSLYASVERRLARDVTDRS